MRVKFSKIFIVAIILIIILLLIFHTFDDKLVHVDNTSVLLVFLLMLIPYLPKIKKVKYGDFEAEIEHSDIKQIEESLDKVETPEKKILSSTGLEGIKEIALSDPTVALLKIRIAIEERLKYIVDFYYPDVNKKHMSISQMLRKLVSEEIIDNNLAAGLKDILSVANRAIHGEKVDSSNLNHIIDLSEKAITSLDTATIDRAISSASSKKIKRKEAELLWDSPYELKTIIAYDGDYEENTYLLKNYYELAMILSLYDFDLGEEIISIKNIGTKNTKK